MRGRVGTKKGPRLGTSGAQGHTYEARMCMLLFARGYIRDLKDFKLLYQVLEAGKFDDIVFDAGNELYQMFQLKHKESVTIKITHSQLFTDNFNTDYNLIKYVKAVINANSNQQFTDKIKTAVVFTNIPIDLTNDELSLITNQTPAAQIWYNGLTSIKLKPITLDASAIFDMSSKVSDAKYYKFTDDPNIVQILKKQAVTLAKDVGDVTENEIREALDKIIYAVQQPNVTKLTELIKEEIKDHFKLNDADPIYNILEKQFRDWCDTKCLFGTQSNVARQDVLAFTDADRIFQANVKRVSFGNVEPTSVFTGRTQELNQIKNQLNKESKLIVSQSVTIAGLGGIGKTQLTRQFVKEFGQSEFYGRVIWIESEDDGTVKESFDSLAQVLNIRYADEKDTKIIIYKVFEYFEGFKVLFVFDNFDKSIEFEGSLVANCLKMASDPNKKYRPYFLFTSRNRNCVPGVLLFDLSVLSEEDAVGLIFKELIAIKPTRPDAEKLAEVLQYFPLALRQANAYIKKQHEMKEAFGEKYDIQGYLKNFDTKKQDLLDYKFPGEFGVTEKTTFITWEVTLDVIKADKDHGRNAIEALRVCSYIYADKFDLKMFLTLFENDKERTWEAFKLLKNYSMITKIKQDKRSFYQIHRLVQTVVQLKFQNENVEAFLEKTCRLINPILYDVVFNNQRKFNENKASDLMKKCSVDQLVHYNALSVHMFKFKALEEKYEDFFSEINTGVLLQAAYYDDVEKIKAMKVSTKYSRKFIESYLDDLIERNSNNVIKYFIRRGYLKVNDQIKEKSLIKWAIEKDNVQIFKYLIEQDGSYKEIVENTSVTLISTIINGKVESFNKNQLIQGMLSECFFYATLFGRKSILQDMAKPHSKFKEWPLPYVAAIFGYIEILELLVQKCSKDHLKQCLIKLLKDRNFSDKRSFEVILNKHREKGGYFNHEDLEENYYEKFSQTKGDILRSLSNITDPQMCMLLFVRGYIRGMKDFKLEYQVPNNDTFIDILFDDGSGKYEMVQLEYKNDQSDATITTSNFIEKFNLVKYVKNMINVQSIQRLKGNVITPIILTNMENVESITCTELTPNSIFNTSPEAKFYKLTGNNSEIVENLMRDTHNVTEDEIREALDKLVFGVQQPTVTKLSEIIKTEIKHHFKLHDDKIYENLEKMFKDWCDTKNSFGQLSTSSQSNATEQPFLTYADADNFFKERVKQVCFDVTAPTAGFTGRSQELQKINELLKNNDLDMPHTAIISGLDGIGKTQLAKQFIKEFSQSEFYGRVMWIEAQSDKTVKNSFKRLAQLLKIKDFDRKEIEVLIHEIFEYFEGIKVLFVFDNFDRDANNGGMLVNYCLKIASDPINKGRPCFLFTSRYHCLPGVAFLDLDVLSLEDAVQLIQKELTEVNPTMNDAKKLAKVLQHFPLALRQAIPYIKQQHKLKQLFGKKYEIQDYFEKFYKETKYWLDIFPDEKLKTTFITWNVTLDAIKADEDHGENAIQVLRVLGHINGDKIDAEMFLPLFQNNVEKNDEALDLLEKYSIITKVELENSFFYRIHGLVQDVIQQKFQNQDETAFLDKTCRLIYPELYDNYFTNNDENVAELIEKCSPEQLLHFKTLSDQMLNHKNLRRKYERFFYTLDTYIEDACCGF